ncbi:TlpA disulfide reductase family protein [Clostridium oceanicum]|uniref:Thioredoxin domain-containing protein n=1 Tax=Clostridium oceanicum TaxID=1543 RepID=A0ABP3UIM2_9CLOT
MNLKKINIYFMLVVILIIGIGILKIQFNKKKTLNKKDIKLTSSENKEDSEEISLKTLKFIPSFNLKDEKDKEINSGIFKDNKITLVNLWGSWSKDSLDELVYIEEIHNEMKDQGVNVIGIVEDGPKNKKGIKYILRNENITFRNIIPNEEFYREFVSLFSSYPYSVIVDSNGKIIEFINGRREKSQYKNLIEKALKK